MAYDEKLAERVRAVLKGRKSVEEKRMMGGLTFMLNDKMCVGVLKDELMARIDPQVHEDALRKKGCREMDFTGRPMRGFVFVGPAAISTAKGLDYWMGLALEFNKQAKASKKRSR